MARMTICFGRQGAEGLRTEHVLAHDPSRLLNAVRQRIGPSHAFDEARIFEDGELRYNVVANGSGAAVVYGDDRSHRRDNI